MKHILPESLAKLRANIIQLNEVEHKYIDLVLSNSKNKIYQQIKIVEDVASKLKSVKDKGIVDACIIELKESIKTKDFKDIAGKALELKEAVKILIESESGFTYYKFKEGKFVKSPTGSVFSEEKLNPGSIYIDFSIPFFPVGNTYTTFKAGLTDLGKRLSGAGRSAVNKAVRQNSKISKYFTGESIWDASLRTVGTEPGSKINGTVELVLHTVPGTITSEVQTKTIIQDVIVALDSFISEYFAEVNKDYQQQYMKDNPVSSAYLRGLKRQMRKAQSDDKTLADKDKDNYGGAF